MQEFENYDSKLIEKFEIHRDFTRLFLDGFVLVNAERKILKFNPAFCQIVDLRAIDVRKIDDFDNILQTKINGQSESVINTLIRSETPTRIDEVQAFNVFTNKTLTLIMSGYPYRDSDGRVLGACILLRNVTAETNLQTKYLDKSIESVTDPLTSLFTRRYFEEQIHKELARCIATHTNPSIAIIMFDLDKFKSVNDTYGHSAGDFVLVETANILKRMSRRSDIPGRFGGEELIVIILNSTEIEAAFAAEKFRSAIENHVYKFEEKIIPVTTSVGVSLLKSLTETKEDVLKRADACLYKAKENGRNVAYLDFDQGIMKVKDFINQSILKKPAFEF